MSPPSTDPFKQFSPLGANHGKEQEGLHIDRAFDRRRDYRHSCCDCDPDLRNGATYEESYAADSAGAYFSGNGTAQGFTPSQNVSVTFTAVAGPPASWTAVATHTLTTKTCSSSANGLISCT